MNILNEIIKFTKENYSLLTLNRYNTTPRIINESVAAHSYFVSLISLFICEKLKNNYNIDFLKVLKISIIHDLAEAELGDIVYPVRQKFKKLNIILNNEEKHIINKKLNSDYKLLFEEFESFKTIESLIVKLADAIDANVYSNEELNMGNNNMLKVKLETEERIKTLWKQLQNARK
jgi:putative hydrolases of HD superfamily